GGFKESPRYWEGSRRVRASFYRHTLADLLALAPLFISEGKSYRMAALGDVELGHVELPNDELERTIREIQDFVRAVEPAWAMDEHEPIPDDALAQVVEAFATLQSCARAVTTNQATPMQQIALQVYIPHPAADHQGRTRWVLRGRLADSII